ncbi:MAG: hypothetical protein IPM42_19015 [Saprospiraceae bacterium]|nr:hypothetical protein [Saprospiraceae bacterium]
MTLKYIFTTITCISVAFGLQSQTAVISGQIASSFVENADIEIQIINLTQSDTIILNPDTSGLFEYNAPIGNDYRIIAKIVGGARSDDFLNGVSTLDQVLILRHILGITPLTSVANIVAADVNLNGKVTASDLVFIRRLILGFNQNFGHTNSWLIRPLSDPKLEFYDIISLQSETMGLDFIPIKLGDVNGTAVGG